jgi:hypothetical protein
MPIPALYGTTLSTFVADVIIFRFVPSMAALANAAMVLFVISLRKPTIVALARSGAPSYWIVCEYILGQNHPAYDSSPP